MQLATSRRAWLVLNIGEEPPALRINHHAVKFTQVRHNGFCLCAPEAQKEGTYAYLDSILHANGFIRLFENFYFPLAGEEISRRRLIKSFFDWLAKDYDDHITKEINSACYDFLMSLTKYAGNSSRPEVLDFGCGSGAALDSGVSSIASELIGYDFSSRMGSVAKARGMRVLSRDDFEGLGPETIDVVICSYVLHYGIPKRQLSRLLSLLRPGGALVGNLHKGYGTQLMVNFLHGIEEGRYHAHWYPSRFGQCLCIEKLAKISVQ